MWPQAAAVVVVHRARLGPCGFTCRAGECAHGAGRDYGRGIQSHLGIPSGSSGIGQINCSGGRSKSTNRATGSVRLTSGSLARPPLSKETGLASKQLCRERERPLYSRFCTVPSSREAELPPPISFAADACGRPWNFICILSPVGRKTSGNQLLSSGPSLPCIISTSAAAHFQLNTMPWPWKAQASHRFGTPGKTPTNDSPTSKKPKKPDHTEQNHQTGWSSPHLSPK